MVTERVRAARSAVELGCSGGISGPGWELGPVGLSDEERRRLDEIERSLQSEGKGFRAGRGRRVAVFSPDPARSMMLGSADGWRRAR